MRYISIDIETTGLRSDVDNVLEFGAILEDTKNPLPYEESKKFRRIIKHEELIGQPYALVMNIEIIKEMISGKIKDIDSNTNNKMCESYDLPFQFKKWLVLECGFDTNPIIKWKENMSFHFGNDILFTKVVIDGSYIRKCNKDDYNSDNEIFYLAHEKSLVIDRLRHEEYESNLSKRDILSGRVKILVAGKNYKGFDEKFLLNLGMDEETYSHQRVIDPTYSAINWDTDEVPPSLSDCKKLFGIEGVVKHTALDDAWDVISVVRAESNNYCGYVVKGVKS